MTSPECQGITQVPYLNNQQKSQSKQVGYSHLDYLKSKHERTKRKDQPWRRLVTVNKIAQKAGYNLPTYREKRTIAELLNQYGEYSYLTGKHLGNYYLSTLDLDLKKEEFSEKLTKRLEKNTACLLNFLKVSYDQTKKGLHVDILTPEPLDNQQIHYQGWGKFWNIGSIQSQGKYVVGEDSNKTFIKSGKWYWKTKNNEEVKATLNKFFFYLNNQEKTVKKSIEINREKELKKVPIQQDFKTFLNKQHKHTIRATILSKRKTCLTDIWKVFYLDQAGKQGYFLFNEYQKAPTVLKVGTVRNMMLIQGRKHAFFSKIL